LTRLVAAVGLVLGVVLAAGCSDDGAGGDDGQEAEPPSSTTAPVTTTTAPPPASDRSLPTTIEAAPDLPGYRIYRPTDLEATGAPLPVVVWANGGCVRHDLTWAALLERWASAGFVVVAIGQPVDGGSPTAVTSAEDQAMAIDWAESQEGDSPYARHLDLDRVVAAGNSCGGITSLALAGEDDRVKAVFILSGSSVGPGAPREAAQAVMAQVTVPVGFAVGGTDDIASSQATQDYEVLPDGVPGMVTSRADGDHVFVSTDAGALADVAEIGIGWMDLVLFGNEAALPAVEDPCPGCDPGLWTATAKHLDTLVTED
jgi:dienelactone hydrolase